MTTSLKQSKKGKYRFPVRWEMYGWVEVEAENADVAVEIVETETKLCDIDAEYMDGSFQIDWEGLPECGPRIG